MRITLDNGCIQVAVDTYGGELQSLKRHDAVTEYLWQGNPATYRRKAINIFPYVARLTNGTYMLDGKVYKMQAHGFIADMEMRCEKKGDSQAVFLFESDEGTMEIDPRRFLYRLKYALRENTVDITYIIQNQDSRTMYFGLGGHPGFRVPLEEGIAFEDYSLEFSAASEPSRIGMSRECFVLDKDEPWELEEGRIQKLSHGLFDDDAIILRDMCREVTLKSQKGHRAVTVCYPRMDYLGIWHWPKTDSPYVCIEPWSSLPSRQGVVEALERQADLIQLGTGEEYRNTWSVSLW